MKALAKLLSITWMAAILAIQPVAFAQEDGQSDFSEAELEQLLAPIALYPDVLLSQILMASTYPLEVVEAARWSRENSTLQGEAAVGAVADQDWDPSVKALVAFPNILARMDQDLRWMERLGDAFLSQQAQVMDAVQALRQKASAAGSLDSLEHVQVRRDQDDIVLEPPGPEVVYVPYYDPVAIYGVWPWPAFPPYYWEPPAGYRISLGFTWGGAVRAGALFL